MKRNFILFYAVNGLGLGHLTRMMSIARKIKTLPGNYIPYFLTTSEACNLLYNLEQFAYTKLPSKTVSKEIGLKSRELSDLYQATILNLKMILKPRALVVDTFVRGSLKDLFGVLTQDFSYMKKVYVHREQRPEKIDPVANLQSMYDSVIIPHSQESGARIPLPKNLDFLWAGPIMIRDRDELLTREEICKRFRLPTNKKIVYVNFGGGGDESAMINQEYVVNVLSKREDIHVVTTQSPLSTSHQPVVGNVSVLKHYPMIELMPAFDAAVSAAGYNTFSELMYTGVPTVFVPKTRGYDDQEKRVRDAVTTNSCKLMLESELVEDNISNQIDDLLGKSSMYSQNAMKIVPENNALKAAQHIVDMLG